jgi:aldose 1-epimerase
LKRFTYSESKFGNYNTIILKDNQTGTNIEIALKGATLLRYQIASAKGLLNIVDGYATPEELTELSGARCCIMAPFSNRIEKGFYVFNDEQHQMFNPVNPQREPIHGFVRVLEFETKEVIPSDDKIELTLFTDKLRKEAFKGYPFNVDVYVKFVLTENKLLMSIIGKNVDTIPIPFSSGWHPYFKTGENGVDHLILTVPAKKIIAVDESLIPYPGEEAYVTVEENPQADFRPELDSSERVIGSREVNCCYFDLVADRKDKLIRTTIEDPIKKLKISIFQKEGVVYAFTGDQAKYRPRRSIALEPVQCITNAYNRHELREKITVYPGKSSVFDFGIEYHFER